VIAILRVPAPVVSLGPISVSLHLVFESLAYAVGFFLYQRDRGRRGDVIGGPDRNSVIVAVILGAAIGSKVLSWFEDPAAVLQGSWAAILGGKTIVGGLLGGTIAVEWAKTRLGITTRTGDLFVIPMALAMAVGRLGCFFGGLDDRTYGTPTNLPWAVDFGDGTPRHPTQLYEIAFLLLLAAAMQALRRARIQNGDLFRLFLFSYCGWRLAIDFLKPETKFAGLSAIQWASAAALIWYSRDVVRMLSHGRRSYLHGRS